MNQTLYMPGSGLEQAVDRWVEEHREAMIQDIFSLVRIRSVAEYNDLRYPYGRGCAEALELMAALADGAGLTWKNHGGYGITAELQGIGERNLGIFCHLDVVDEGSGWSSPPFDPYVRDGHIFGRGSTDNKGPAVAVLYAVRCMKELGLPLQRTVRLFFGGCEEDGMKDIQEYLKHQDAPDLSLVPDARFAVCYGEKGICTADLRMDISNTNIVEFTGGNASNVVPDSAYAVLRRVDCREAERRLSGYPGIHISETAQGIRVQAEGRSGHAAFPENSVNAIAVLCAALRAAELVTGTVPVIEALNCLLGDYYGALAGMDYKDEPSGELTVIGGKVRVRDGVLIQNINIRYPVTMRAEQLMKKLNQFGEKYNMQVQCTEHSAPMFIPPERPMIRGLQEICGQVLGRPMSSYVMGGGTYARFLKNGVAYGGLNADLPRPGGGGHQPDECVSIAGLENLIRIYVKAVLYLDQLEVTQ